MLIAPETRVNILRECQLVIKLFFSSASQANFLLLFHRNFVLFCLNSSDGEKQKSDLTTIIFFIHLFVLLYCQKIQSHTQCFFVDYKCFCGGFFKRQNNSKNCHVFFLCLFFILNDSLLFPSLSNPAS